MAHDGSSSGGPSGNPLPPHEYPLSPEGWQQQPSPVSGGGYAPQAPVSGGEAGFQPPVPQEPNRFKQLWLHPAFVVGILGTLIILIAAVTILAVRSFQAPATVADDSGSQTGDSQEDDPGTADGDDSTQGSESGADGTSPSPEPDEDPADEPYLSGTMDVYADNMLNFDQGDDHLSYDDEEKDFDAQIQSDGIHALGKIEFGEWGDGAPPTTVAECDGLPNKSNSVHVSRIEQFKTFCFNTVEGRTGYLTIEEFELEDNGTLQQLSLSFTVFKGEEDL